MSEWDVVVAGAGPAGAVCAIELARRQRRVLLLDAATWPRYRVGESLSPTACADLESYGVRLDAGGFVRKAGATFVWGDRQPFSTYYAGHDAWQVRRSEMDARLLELAAAAGATVRTGCAVEEILFSGERAKGVAYLAEGGQRAEERATWVVDATGRDALLARQLSLLYQDPTMNLYATWAEWRGGRRLPGRAAGNSLFVGGSPAWWYLPLRDDDDLVGVGMITYDGPPAPGPDAAYHAALARTVLVKSLLDGARPASPIRASTAGSQIGRQMAGHGWLLVGDAAACVDPLLTPGVQLALRFGRQAARTIHAALVHPGHRDKLSREYERRVRRQYDGYHRLAATMYAAGMREPPLPAMEALAGGEEQADRVAFMSLISGIPPERLPALLGGYLGMRGAAGRYGGTPPVFGEAEGFAFLCWVLRHETPQLPALRPSSMLRLAAGVDVHDSVHLPASGDDTPRLSRVVDNAAGDRFLLTRELDAMTRILSREVNLADAAAAFAAGVGAEPDPAAFDDWVRLLGRYALLEWSHESI